MHNNADLHKEDKLKMYMHTYKTMLHSVTSSIAIICIIFLTVPYRSYKFFIYAATIAGEGPQYDGEFLTREDSEQFTYNINTNCSCA